MLNKHFNRDKCKLFLFQRENLNPSSPSMTQDTLLHAPSLQAAPIIFQIPRLEEMWNYPPRSTLYGSRVLNLESTNTDTLWMGFWNCKLIFMCRYYLWASLGLRTHSFPNDANGVPDPSKSEFESKSFLPGHQLSDSYRLLSGLSLQSFTAGLWQQTCD